MQTLCSPACLQCYNHELPAIEGLSERFEGILISGSHYSAYEGGARLRGSICCRAVLLYSAVEAVALEHLHRAVLLCQFNNAAPSSSHVSCGTSLCIPLQSGSGYGSW